MDDNEATTPTAALQSPQSHPSLELPEALPEASPGAGAVEETLRALDRDPDLELKDGHQEPEEQSSEQQPEVLKGLGNPVLESNGLKDGPGWEDVVMDEAADAGATLDEIADSVIVPDNTQAERPTTIDSNIPTDEPQLENGGGDMHSGLKEPQQQIVPGTTSVSTATNPPIGIQTQPQPFPLLENRNAPPFPQAQFRPPLPHPPLPPHPYHQLPLQPQFILPRDHQGVPIPYPIYPPQNAAHYQPGFFPPPPQVHPLPPALHNLMPNFSTPPGSASPDADLGPSHLKDMKLVANPPDLEQWRERLFNVDEPIILSEEEFQTYFPHVDNVYSHRSTQRYKRKPFISHYWDCRLKGRPPGTPKSVDPNKKKRKRTARERNLCDVKIKITEYFPGAYMMAPELDIALPNLAAANANGGNAPGGTEEADSSQPFGILAPSTVLPESHPGASGARYYTIQRVNGNGQNGRLDTAGGNHKHTLEESDRIKKNSVQRFYLKDEREKKRALSQQLKSYHKKASGYAWLTVNKHKKDSDLKLYASCFCPFVQRVWIALEVKGIPYQYIEVDPYKKPDSLLEVNPRGLVPAIRHGNWGCHESTVLLEYLDDIDAGNPILPPNDPQLRAHCRLWSDHINRNIIPCFYRLLQEQDVNKQAEHTEELKNEISKLVDQAHVTGPFFLGPSISLVDIQFAPWMLRLSRVLKPYRGWPDPEKGSRWAAWLEAVEANDQVLATTSSDELYLDSYQRYAENRPDTSQLANAINSGRPLP